MVIGGKDARTQHIFCTGDVVHVKSQSPKLPKFGRIVKFLRTNPSSADEFESHPDTVFVSGSDRGLKCQIEPLPAFCYSSDKPDKPQYGWLDPLPFIELIVISEIENDR